MNLILNRHVGGLPFALALLLCGRLPAGANPTGGSVAQGSASFNTSGSHLTINQTSANAFINWQSFNIGAGETTTFVQPSSSSLVWNQINDANPSQILGNLNANGYVVLQNANGFYIGGQAAISTHGLVLTTASTPALDLSGGGAWDFAAPAPTAQIINYGRINIAGGGSAFLIASDIENNGTISAPGGQIGLYAGQKVLVSMAPDGRGLSAEVTLPQGTVDNHGQLIADAGSIAAQAQFVNQAGLIQANSVRDVNGTIELLASDAVNLGASSVISAQGAAQSTSAGGTVVIKAGKNFSDQAGSLINIAGGAQGGNGGQVEISASQMGAIQSGINGRAQSGYVGGKLSIDPYDLTLDAAYVGSLNNQISGGLSQISLQADHNIELSTAWNLADLTSAGTLSLTAGNSIILDDLSAIVAGTSWSVAMTAGASLPVGTLPAAGMDGIYLNGNAYLQTRDGGVNLQAANEVIVNSGAVRTIGGGSISVTTLYGDVNTGSSISGFNYIKNAPYFTPFSVNPFLGTVGTSSSLGGISTAKGGNVTISAGGNVVSYLPTGTGVAATGDAGTGAFGSQPGDVTINAGGNVSGHYVVVNGTGVINAGQDVGNQSQNVALSLVKGSWSLNAPNGNIFLQEVRNPNGVFNAQGTLSTAQHLFNYDPLAAVNLTAGDGVYLTGLSLPRAAAVPIILPPSLNISAGAGGVTLEDNFTLFPSSYGNLQITTTHGGDFSSGGESGLTYELLMSDSAQTHWFVSDSGTQPFSSTDHGGPPAEFNNSSPVLIHIDGSMNNLILQTTKATQITVGGDMTGCGFYGQNLHAGDITSIAVAGQIFNPGSFNYVTLNQGIQNLPLTDLPPGTINNWQTVLTLAVDPARVASLQIPAGVDPSQYAGYINQVLLFGNSLQSSFAYNPATKNLTFIGSMSQTILNALSQPLQVVRFGPNGDPLVDSTGHFVTDTINWVAPSAIQNLYTASQGAPALGNSSGGYVVGGTGAFNISASSLSLGNAYGILSLGNGKLLGADYSYLTPYLQTQPGATINVTLAGNLEMPSSTIAALGGGNVNVTSTGGSMDLGSQYLVQFEAEIMRGDNLGLGIYTSGGGDVNVSALGNINIDSSRIATFNGGDIYIESLTGDVNAGSGGNVSIPINVFSAKANLASQPFEQVYANGIAALTLVNASQVPDSATVPGNITVKTLQGNIYASQGGILQEALNGNISAGPTITLEAGSKDQGYAGNIDLGNSGVIGGTVNLSANGNITGLVISRQNSTVNAAQSFSGTVLSGGTANLSAGGTVSGTVIGVGGVSAAGAGGVTASLLGQNVSVNGGAAASTLGTSATATSTSQSAAGTASDAAKQQVATDTTEDDDLKKKKKPQIHKISRVTVLLSSAGPAQ